MAEKVTEICTTIEALWLAFLVMRLAVRTMSASSSLRPSCVFDFHTTQARIKAGCEGKHLSSESRSCVWEFNLGHHLFNGFKEIRGVSFTVEDPIVKVALDVILLRVNLASFQLLVVRVKPDSATVNLVQTDMQVNFVVEEHPGMLFQTSNY